jgi:hypothetical protein
VTPVTISEANKPGPAGHAIAGGNMSIYRPALTHAANAAPAHVVPIENVKTVNATALHGVLPRAGTMSPVPQHTTETPHSATQPRPATGTQNGMNEGNRNVPVQSQPAQQRPAQTEPAQQQRPALAQQNNNQNQNQNRQPKPQQQPKPKPQPKPAPQPKPERH